MNSKSYGAVVILFACVVATIAPLGHAQQLTPAVLPDNGRQLSSDKFVKFLLGTEMRKGMMSAVRFLSLD